MEPPALPPSPKLRLMCSYGGQIIPRPHDKSLFYAAGETRLVSIDRRTTAASISALTAHLSRVLFNNNPFHLKYQLPNEDLDSLISVITDEDLANMIDEHDRVVAPARIRLFLFPVVKAENSGPPQMLDSKSETWFCDALKSTRILQSTDSVLLMEFGSGLENPVETVNKVGAESVVLETSSSFGSTLSGLSMSNSPSGGTVRSEDNGGLNLLDKSVRVPSSASLASENSVGGVSTLPKNGNIQEPLIQVTSEASSLAIASETTSSNLSISIPAQTTLQLPGYPASQHLGGNQLQHQTQVQLFGYQQAPQQQDGKQLQHETQVQLFGYQAPQQQDGNQLQQETQFIQGGMHYLPQYPVSPMPFSPYYPVYQMPMQQQQQQQQQSQPQNQPCPMYLYPIPQTQYHNMPPQYNFIDANTTTSRPPLHQTAVMTPHIPQQEVFVAQPAAESVPKVFQSVPPSTPVVTGSSESEKPLEPVTKNLVACEFVEDGAFNQVYKTQPSPPGLPVQSQKMVNGMNMLLPESSIQLQPTLAKEPAVILPNMMPLHNEQKAA